MQNIGFSIHDNGTFDITCGGIKFSNIVPEADERPLIPSSVNIDDVSVTYFTEWGSMRIGFMSNEDELVLSTEAVIEGSVHDIEPIGHSLLDGAESVYFQGFGMEGPSGYRKIGSDRIRSYGLVGLDTADGDAVSIYADDHSRFTTQFSVGDSESLYKTETVFVTGIDLEGTVSGKISLPALHFKAGKDIMSCMSYAAESIAEAMNARTYMEPAFHWCSWYYYYENMDQHILDDMLCHLKEDPIDFRYIQLDAGYVDHTGDWKKINSRYPEGLGKAAKDIIDAGFAAGIWIGPLMIGDQSETYRDHPDWIVRNKDGSPYTVFRSYTEPKIWGNTDNDYFVIDTTNPDAMNYLREVFTELRGYGFTLFKTDFLLWCMKDTSEVIRYNMNKTSVEVLRDLYSMIREVIGEESYLLASIAPYMASIGFADGVRIAGDMGASWEGAYGPENLLKELPYDNYFNNVFWQNDPDSVMLRDFGTHLSEKETLSLALLQAVSGGVITTSDPVSALPEKRRELLNFIKPSGKVHAELPLLTENREEIVITHKLHDWNLLYVLNPADHPVNVFYKLDELFGAKALFQYRFNIEDGKSIESEKISYFSDSISPHESVLLFITEEPLTEKPANMWGRQL